MLRFLPLSAALLFLVFSCTIITDSGLDKDYPGDENVSWVQKTIEGGQQCVPNDGFVPPDTKKVLNQIGIPVFETKVARQATCRACYVCPSYSALHYALIPNDKVERALGIDFVLSNGPQNHGR